MSIHVALRHRTSYRYDRLVALSPQTVRLRPAPHCRTPVLSYALNIKPKKHFLNWVQDPHGNFLARLVFPERTDRFEVDVDLVVDMAVINPFDFFLEPSAENYPFAYDPTLEEELAPFRRKLESGPLFAAWLARVDRSKRRMNDFLVEINQRLQKDIAYIVRLEPGVQTPEQTLALAKGSCRDTGWLLVQILRHLGFAARFVSGYLIQLTADQKPLEGPEGPTHDFTDLHAWTEVYLPGSGWIGLDPTSGLFAAEGHIPLACTPEPSNAAPVSGLVEPAEVAFEFAMNVTRIRETPRVTKPYTEEAWSRIVGLGRTVDRDLVAGDVRLTMGGEPTFVSIDDMEGEEWNFTALGENKRRLAGDLFRRLTGRLAPGALLHYGQGKWYPGEPLPRWALSCYWRKDGEPIWRNQALLVDPALGQRGNATIDEAKRLALVLAARLGVTSKFLAPAYEDAAFYLWRESRLPVNVDPRQAKIEDPLERERLARLFAGELREITGFVLPLTRVHDKGVARWHTEPWYCRGGVLFLVPGDSPIGLRLPLDALPWVRKEDMPIGVESDPMADHGDLPSREELARLGPVVGEVGDSSHVLRPPPVGESAPDLVRTALCIEPRAGYLHVFMPPLEEADDYLALLAAIEDSAAEFGHPVVIEGYVPPYDARIESFSVTPDPGVIEVNIHPATDWDDIVKRTTLLYEEARQVRLGSEKFMLDGRHTGTGGGNHFVIGGPTPADSPLLRRPDLLRSLLGFWNNHPSLSYLFSGLFLGPTSQHPRVDEARDDALYELEIAFSQVTDDSPVAPWKVDRIFRNLLVDVTGNTHRAEFCIDKLYTPDSASGRRGLLELRAFEMPPHSRMSLAQQLLLRAIVAWMWRQPFKRSLIRWGTRLHDEFMLPHFVWRDFNDVIEELRQAGYAFDAAWFLPHLEFRFPLIGSVAYRGVDIEFRQALEPWPVMGEQAAAGGMSRSVDSSVERLQVRARGLADGRFVVACNGIALPLQPTGVESEAVAGVRYRAWQPPNALHPEIPVHAPLVFDVYDTWTEATIGGCTYHVAHPGGRSYDRFPVNANEAEARRRGRFQAIGQTGTGKPPERVAIRPELPVTL
ncbi:MAG: transglutaminase family protein, partial [Alphaproteobacteria bacterium]|nr:transglutaminase family protein [Alphaproteobacteria bacterium]